MLSDFDTSDKPKERLDERLIFSFSSCLLVNRVFLFSTNYENALIPI